ncbi:hypothetical protein Drose_32485 [Dactylosporangium roseum]|uniref:Uncharacterized protein n=1 Tax=Dactylosporangium roseum TaxID=47989 RepID=A0ABY5Z156_9ACTN|nr:hypothetical protein [Dactylosporangium roseum]UWZ35769.1 hypothetical protein Drose_32485 [Dactylosporangium roseum]
MTSPLPGVSDLENRGAGLTSPTVKLSRQYAEMRDGHAPIGHFRARFHIPKHFRGISEAPLGRVHAPAQW